MTSSAEDKLAEARRSRNHAADQLDQAALHVIELQSERDSALAEVRDLRAKLDAVRNHLRYMSSPTMGLPSNRDAIEYVATDARDELVRLALGICIENARVALEKIGPVVWDGDKEDKG